MKNNAKSSITLPVGELELVNRLVKDLGAKSKVEVVRRGLRLLQEQVDRERLREAYANAAGQVADSVQTEIDELDHLAGEGIED